MDHNSIFSEAIDFMVKVLEIFKFPQIKVCFNGGKDATVILYLVKMAIEKLKLECSIECIYFSEEHPFPEILDFIDSQQTLLNLKIDKHNCNVKESLKKYNGLQAVVMGTRRSDPHGKDLSKISITDKDYPSLLRINPILDWTYSQIWEFIRFYNIPYCSLYDQGYMCLGSRNTTKPNEKYKEGMKPWEFESDHERICRIE